MTPVFEVRDVAYRYPGAPANALTAVDLCVAPGEMVGIIGPNGSGKSTLLRLLLGALVPSAGTVLFLGRPLAEWPRRDLATRIGAVAQSEEVGFPLTVREMVGMGRYPHLGAWRSEGEADRAAVAQAMARCDVTDLGDRTVGALSGGERQRVRIARALAQLPGVLVLDEPTGALDIRHEMEIFELLRVLAGDGVTVILVTHHLNLAARYAHTLVLLERGRVAARGAPDTVLEREIVERVYGWPVARHPHPGPGGDAGAPQIVPLSGA